MLVDSSLAKRIVHTMRKDLTYNTMQALVRKLKGLDKRTTRNCLSGDSKEEMDKTGQMFG